VEVQGEAGTEGRSFLIAEGRAEGRLSARYRGANFPRRRVDGALTPDFRGALETDDGATILFAWQGLAALAGGTRRLVGSMTHVTDDDRYRWMNDRVYAVAGEVRPRSGEAGFDVVLDSSCGRRSSDAGDAAAQVRGRRAIIGRSATMGKGGRHVRTGADAGPRR
jgi:hypothetical protein